MRAPGRPLAVVPMEAPKTVRLRHHRGVAHLVDDLVAAPIGVGLLDRLELAERGLFRPYQALGDCEPSAVERAAESVEAMSIETLLHLALDAADSLAGPWNSRAPGSLARAYELAPERRALAEAISRRFADVLVGPSPVECQEHWLGEPHPAVPIQPGLADFSQVYANGEFTWSGFWTVSSPPAEIHDDLVAAWELDPGPISRWRLRVRPDARVWRIDRPSDWVGLVERFPMAAARPHDGWELPGPNQYAGDVAYLASLTGQHAVRTTLERHLLPDWTAVAREYDGVHLSWAGFITAEGFVSDLPGRGGTMLRYWGSERTLWLADVFGVPEPLGAPRLSGAVSGALGIDLTRGHEARLAVDRESIDVRLSRPSGSL